MPTTRTRHVLTETDEVAAAIDAAAPLFPGATRADILRRLIHIAFETITEQQVQRRIVVRELAGRYPGVYGPGSLDELREDWRE